MQSKGLIRTLLILIAIVCAIQLFYYVPTQRIEKDAESYAELMSDKVGEESKYVAYKSAKANYLDSMSSETVLNIPGGFGSYTYNDLKKRQLALGLDLKGGMSSVLQVDLKDMLKTLAGRNSKDAVFVQALEAAEKAQESSQSDYITLFADAYKSLAPGTPLNKLFLGSGMLQDVNVETGDGEIVRLLRQKGDETVSLTYRMLKERINKMGVAQPNVTLDEGRDLILVEMPGIDNPKRAREFLQASAQLEFWDSYRASDPGILAALQTADSRLAATMGKELSVKKDTTYTYTYDENGNVTDSTAVVTDGQGFADQGPLLSNLTLNGTAGVGFARTVLGIADKNKMSSVSDLLAKEDIRALFPKNSKFLWSYQPYEDAESGESTHKYELYLIKTQPGTDKAPMEGDVVTEASQTLDPNTGEPEVSLRMNSEGSKAWARMTTNAFNNGGREIAIVLDDQVVSTPSVNNGPITGGSTSISGGFNVQQAIDFANILEVGKLPAKTKIIQESTVGPSLGAQNIKASTTSLLVGFGLVLLFMLLYYGGAGIVSILALLLNVLFIFGALSSFGTVLTLPGIAGIVLTIGMAVDANVIIFERVKEELREGKGILAAVAEGFKNSYSAIIDANVTTLLVAIVLAYFGLGPIKGFAVVLIIGVVSSLITAVLFAKLLIDGWLSKDGRQLSFWTGFSKNLFTNMNIDWLGKRKMAYIISGVLLVASVLSIMTRGFDLGVDFKGGYSYNVQFDGKDITRKQMSTALDEAFGSNTIIKKVDTENTYNITTTYLVGDKSEDADERVNVKLFEGLNALAGGGLDYDQFLTPDSKSPIKVTSFNKVGATIADDIKNSSWLAGLSALILIFLYIFIRFNRWQFSLGAVAALVHDSIILLGVFSLARNLLPFSLEIDQAFIAALLTIIGYSINDTVIVFDRIREFLGIYTNKSKDTVLNMAINSTFSRTIMTSFTTLIVVLILLIFGGASIKGFAFALFVGILVGTYSSIFVATPIVREFSDDLKQAFIEEEVSEAKPVVG